MKNIFFTILFLAFGMSMQAQGDAITKYFQQYQDDERFTMISISPKMFEMIAQIADDDMDEDLTEMLKELRGLKILTTDQNPRAFYKEALQKINTSEYEELMTVRDKDSDVQFLIKDQQNGNIVNELLLLVGGEDDFVFMSFAGKIHLDKIAKLAKNMNIDGAEHLEKLEK